MRTLPSRSGGVHAARVLRKFLLYGFAGWVVEVLFTGASSAAQKDRAATAKTYLWMHPIYGATALGLEWLSRKMKPVPLPVRGLVYTAVMYGAEYSSGWVLRRALGKCPWDYSASGRDVHGLIRWDYAPAWYALGLMFEPLKDQLVAPAAKPPVMRRLREAVAR